MGFYYTLSLREDSTSSTPLSLLIHACHDCTQGRRNCYTERQWFGISEPVIAWVMGVVPVSFRATEPHVLVVIIVMLHDFIFSPQLHQSTALHHLSLRKDPCSQPVIDPITTITQLPSTQETTASSRPSVRLLAWSSDICFLPFQALLGFLVDLLNVLQHHTTH